MNEDEILKCLIAFIIGYLLCRYMGNGFSVGGTPECNEQLDELFSFKYPPTLNCYNSISASNCMECIGEHQGETRKAGCKQTDFENWCNKEPYCKKKTCNAGEKKIISTGSKEFKSGRGIAPKGDVCCAGERWGTGEPYMNCVEWDIGPGKHCPHGQCSTDGKSCIVPKK